MNRILSSTAALILSRIPGISLVVGQPALFAFLLLPFLPFTVSAQDPSPIPDKDGTWSYAYLNDENTKMYAREFGMTPDEIAVFRQKLDNIVNVLHQAPVMVNPKGIDPTVESRPLYPHGFKDHMQNYGYVGEINFRLCPPREPAYRVMLDGIRQEFSGLSAAQLKSPAYYGGMFSGITPEPNDAPLFLFNNDYFERSKPKTAIQLVVFLIDADYFRKESDFIPNDVGFLRINQFLHSLDPAVLVTLID